MKVLCQLRGFTRASLANNDHHLLLLITNSVKIGLYLGYPGLLARASRAPKRQEDIPAVLSLFLSWQTRSRPQRT